MFVRKPTRSIGCWKVVVSESVSPLSKVIEVIECASREEAWRAYRKIQKERGVGL
jgi:hypothetical protein